MARERAEGQPDRKAFAARIGMGRNTVARYESWNFTGQKRAMVKAWAQETGCPFEWLWDGETPGGQPVTQRYRAFLKAA